MTNYSMKAETGEFLSLSTEKSIRVYGKFKFLSSSPVALQLECSICRGPIVSGDEFLWEISAGEFFHNDCLIVKDIDHAA